MTVSTILLVSPDYACACLITENRIIIVYSWCNSYSTNIKFYKVRRWREGLGFKFSRGSFTYIYIWIMLE